MAFIFNWDPERTQQVRRRLQHEATLREAEDSAPALPTLSRSAPSLHASGAAVTQPQEAKGLKSRKKDATKKPGARKTREAQEQKRPASPGAWLGELQKTAMQPLDMEGCTEYHRHYWFHPGTVNFPLGRTMPFTGRGPECARDRKKSTGIGARDMEYGSLKSDSGTAGCFVEQAHRLRKMRGSKHDEEAEKAYNCKGITKSKYFGSVEPLVFVTELNRRGLNPSMASEGTTSCMVGGSQLCLPRTRPPGAPDFPERRQVGLYEDSFKVWRGDIHPPKHGLASSDVTAFADLMVTQKSLMRT
eukprot:TRINITY_DN14451_c0_g2_i3.p1 TRINITY_DN14451_c0_g2~~TRINITY_DN14451_c0_g2_i3.p1  ORF type:complete len:302 (+),score=65.01 TRINITY_DN14451_c0_g2_i3:109-1014(+)